MIKFKQDVKIAFDGINIEVFEAGVAYELSEEKQAKVKSFGIEFEKAGESKKPTKKK